MKHYKHVQGYNQTKLKENIPKAAMNVSKSKALYYIFQSLSNQQDLWYHANTNIWCKTVYQWDLHKRTNWYPKMSDYLTTIFKE